MNKFQEALNGIIECYEELESRVGNDPNKVREFPNIKALQELIDRNAKLEKAINMLKEHFEIYYDIYVDGYVLKSCLPLEMHLSNKNYKILDEVLYDLKK